MNNSIETVMINEAELQARISQLAVQLSEDYQDKDPILVGVLKGVVLFFGDIVKRITVPCQIDFMCISSYEGTSSTGNICVKKDISENIKGRHIVILEDIFDTGNSLNFVYDYLQSKEPASLKICTLLDKPDRRNPNVTLQADYTGFVIPNEFVVGYGLDYNEHYRNLPYIGILKPGVYQA